MIEQSPEYEPTPEEVAEAQAAALARNEANEASGNLDGLEELRAEVAADPVSVIAYLKDQQRLSEED